MNFFLFLFLFSWAIYRIIPIVLEYLNMQASKRALPKALRAYYDAAKYKELQKGMQKRGNSKLILLTIELFLGWAVIGFGIIGIIHDWVVAVFANAYVVNLVFAIVVLVAWEGIRVYRYLFVQEGKVIARLGRGLFNALFLGLLIGGGICLMQVLQRIAPTWLGLLIFSILLLFRMLSNRVLTIFMQQSSVASINQWNLVQQGILKTATPILNKIPKEGTLAKLMETACNYADVSLGHVFAFQTTAHPIATYSHAFVWKKRIFLSEYILDTFSAEEVMSIVYHELWHIKHRSMRPYLKLLAELVVCIAFGFFVSMPMANTFSADASLALVTLSYWILLYPFQLIYQLIDHSLSRIQEWKADVYAYRKSDRKVLAKALGKLGALKMESATPHPLYVQLYYSHPPLLERLSIANKAPNVGHVTEEMMEEINHEEQREDILEQLDQIKAQLGHVKSVKEEKAERKAELEKRAVAKSKRIKKLRKKKK